MHCHHSYLKDTSSPQQRSVQVSGLQELEDGEIQLWIEAPARRSSWQQVTRKGCYWQDYAHLKPVRSGTSAAGESTKQEALLSQFTQPFDRFSSSCVSVSVQMGQQQGESNEHLQSLEESEDQPKTTSLPSAVPTNTACRKRVRVSKSVKEIPAKRQQCSPKIEKSSISMAVSSSE